MISNVTDAKHVAAPPSAFAQSVSIAALLKAGTVVKRKVPEKLSLDQFDLQSITWKDFKEIEVFIEKKSFTKDAFREAFKATSSNNSLEHWVIKKYSHESQETMETLLDINPIDHTKKQYQMHAVARNIVQRLKKYAPTEFGVAFDYNRVYIAMLDNCPITVEEFVEGEFQKYANNTGECMVPPNNER